MSRLALCLLLLLLALGAPAQAAPVPLVVELSLNGETRGAVLLLEEDERFFIDAADARAWRLRVPEAGHISYQGRSFLALDSIYARIESLDRSSLRLELRVPADAFEASRASIGPNEYPLTPAVWGGYASYDLVGTRSGGRSGIDGALQLAGFSPYGGLDTTLVKRNVWASDGADGDLQRYSTTYRRDWAELMSSVEVGDTFSRASANTRALRVGGLWFGTNFNLRPGFISQPLPSFTGQASLPSTVQVFVNNQLRAVTEVPAGPFHLDNVPVINGAGDARLVVRDALGRESVVNASFYSTSGLLAPGLSQYSVALGRLRRDGLYGEPDYGPVYGAASFRRGLSRSLTVEASAEFEASRAALVGMAMDFALPLGEMELAWAAADPRAADGGSPRGRVAAGYSYQDWLSAVSFRYERAASGMVVPGDLDPQLAQRSLLTASASRRFTERTSLGAAWISAQAQDGRSLRTANLSATVALQRRINLLFSLNRVSDGLSARRSAQVLLSVPLGPSVYATASVEAGSQPRQTLAAQQSPPLGEGWGWRLGTAHDSSGTRADAGLIAQLPAATLQVEANQQPGLGASVRAQAQGSVAWIGHRLTAMRQVSDAFAWVDIPGAAEVPVLLNNQPVGRTDADGRLLVPRLMSYVPSEIKLDVTGLPPDAEIEPGRERVVVVPPARTAVRAELGVRRVAAAIVRVVGADGQPVPAGAAVEIEHEGQSTSVAGKGEFYVSGAPGPRRAKLSWRGQGCTVDFDLPPAPAGQAYSQLGPYPCVTLPR